MEIYSPSFKLGNDFNLCGPPLKLFWDFGNYIMFSWFSITLTIRIYFGMNSCKKKLSYYFILDTMNHDSELRHHSLVRHAAVSYSNQILAFQE